MPETVAALSDAHFAGRKRARRSTAGSVVVFGNHYVITHRQTQETVSLSSGESEFYSIAKAATMGLGMKGLMEDLGD